MFTIKAIRNPHVLNNIFTQWKSGACVFIAVLFSLASNAQDPIGILQKSYIKCQSIDNGYYEMNFVWKPFSDKDTVRKNISCYFKRVENDNLSTALFNFKLIWGSVYAGEMLYTGNEFVMSSSRDSSSLIAPKGLWPNEIRDYIHSFDFYVPFTNKLNPVFPHDSDYIDKKHFFSLIGTENINGYSCYHVRINVTPENYEGGMFKTIGLHYDCWINKDDFIPVQYSNTFEDIMKGDTVVQYRMYSLAKYEINHLKDENIFILNSIPAYYKRKDYVPYRVPDLLSKGTVAPDWELLSTEDKKTSLNSLKGKLVLVDFFYKSCYPCLQALPALQSLSEKYKAKGLRVIGIDPLDKKEDNMPLFLSKQGVTYTVLLGGSDVAKNYHISGYPTMYLIDKNGKIVFIQAGYGNGIEKVLEDEIKKNL